MENNFREGGFTLPGEAGYEALTLKLAEKWGADVIRDSDGTRLSDAIVKAGYGIYSTVCVIREHNDFISKHPLSRQQAFLCSEPVTADDGSVTINLLKGYFAQQFEIDDRPGSVARWQVYDRTTDTEIAEENWHYENGCVTIENCIVWHEYTVSFLCWRVWEEISMYNHTTNHWTKEHLMQLDPRDPDAWAYLIEWMESWCRENPDTTVVRFTSLFYNFSWYWGESERHRNLYTDWASYDFTVSLAALEAFEMEYGYAIRAEDFIHQRKLQATHMPPTKVKCDWMDFIQCFVAEKAKALVDIVHRYGKKAYVFYDDSWVGMEPYGKYFASIGFDGLIKCVFSGFECRLCANVPVPVHELRFHPYLFPVGLGGLPTFSEGGDPARDAKRYWRNVRRALLVQPVDRIGLGGYLHLTQDYPDFVDTIETMGIEFRKIRQMHRNGRAELLPIRVAVLHTWGSLRSWTLSGHFHETDKHILIHINEALSGLPVSVRFISFEDVLSGALEDADVVINAGRAGDAWSGGDAWKDSALVVKLTEFVHRGGSFIGVGEPGAVEGYHTFFRMAHVLGIDKDTGARVCHGRRGYSVSKTSISVDEEALGDERDLYLTADDTIVLSEKNGVPQMTLHGFGKGTGVYMSGFTFGTAAVRMLLETLLYVRGLDVKNYWLSDSAEVETAYFPANRTLVTINNAERPVKSKVYLYGKPIDVDLEPLETGMIRVR